MMLASRTIVSSLLVAASIVSASSTARAIRPDFDGERGIEAQVQVGLGGVSNTSQRVITENGRSGVTAPPSVLGPGFNFRAQLGYRIMPAFSVGAAVSFNPLGAFPLSGTPDIYNYGASTLSAGVYGRLYFLALVSAIPRTTRVEFSSWGDLRRLDPYVSLGVEYQSIAYTQNNRVAMQVGASFARTSISAPVGLGFEYRLLQPLAVGLGAVLAPSFGAWVSRSVTTVTGGNIQSTQDSFIAEDPVNLAWSLGLTARYTLTL